MALKILLCVVCVLAQALCCRAGQNASAEGGGALPLFRKGSGNVSNVKAQNFLKRALSSTSSSAYVSNEPEVVESFAGSDHVATTPLSASLVGLSELLTMDDPTPGDVLQLSAAVGLNAIAAVNPLLGAAGLFAWAMIAGMVGTDSTSNEVKLYRAVLQAAGAYTDKAIMAERVRNGVAEVGAKIRTLLDGTVGDELSFLENRHYAFSDVREKVFGADCMPGMYRADQCREWRQQGGAMALMSALGLAITDLNVLVQIAVLGDSNQKALAASRIQLRGAQYVDLLQEHYKEFKAYRLSTVTFDEAEQAHPECKCYQMPHLPPGFWQCAKQTVNFHPRGQCVSFYRDTVSSEMDARIKDHIDRFVAAVAEDRVSSRRYAAVQGNVLQYDGCFSNENSFLGGAARAYGGDGGSLTGGVISAVENGYGSVAIANNPSNGHRFAFKDLPTSAVSNLPDASCMKGCDNGAGHPCGCADNYNSNTCHRAWAVWTLKPTVTINGKSLQYIGCFSNENAFDSKVYGGDGGSLSGGVAAALDASLNYVAIANNPANGHRFAFRSLLGAANLPDASCSKGCDGTGSYSMCGCADNLNSNACHRAWAVYRLPAVTTAAARVCAEAEGDFCPCQGEVYYGKKYVEGKPGSGWTTSFDQLKSSGFLKQSGGRLCSSTSMGGDPVHGYFKWCYCVQ